MTASQEEKMESWRTQECVAQQASCPVFYTVTSPFKPMARGPFGQEKTKEETAGCVRVVCSFFLSFTRHTP